MTRRLPLLWPTIIVLSILAVGLVSFVMTDITVRPLIVMWFLFICPGMALVWLLHPEEPVVKWTLAIALSLAIDAIVAGILMYAGQWSPMGTLLILMAISLGGILTQIGYSRFNIL